MEQLTVYRAQGKEIGICFLFKYDLNGHLKAFEVAEGNMNANQVRWLVKLSTDGTHTRFPAFEADFKERWLNDVEIKAKFDIKVSPADISFEAWWKIYNLKVKKELTEKAWKKLSEADQIDAFLALPRYEAFLTQSGQAKAHPVTWINQKRWLDEYPEVFTPPPKQHIGKVYNSTIQDLAAKKAVRNQDS